MCYVVFFLPIDKKKIVPQVINTGLSAFMKHTAKNTMDSITAELLWKQYHNTIDL